MTGLSDAALILNKEIWHIWNITFQANQTPDIMSPFQVLWSLTGLTVYQSSAMPYRSINCVTPYAVPHSAVMQVIEAGHASCTGLSIFLVNALRAVGIPARMAGTEEAASPRHCQTLGQPIWTVATTCLHPCSRLCPRMLDVWECSEGKGCLVTGTPQWNTVAGGNHDWVEVWDRGVWSFTGPTEYTVKVHKMQLAASQVTTQRTVYTQLL